YTSRAPSDTVAAKEGRCGAHGRGSARLGWLWPARRRQIGVVACGPIDGYVTETAARADYGIVAEPE
ncbi:MAG: hypothetical protein ACREET_10440, partial [Stellaceae bacterium]